MASLPPPDLMPSDRDVISITDLQLPLGVIAPNIWSEEKAQPATLSLSLTLRYGVGSAADSDALDQSTVHYGDLSKRIRAACSSSPLGVLEMYAEIEAILQKMGARDDGTTRLSEVQAQIKLPKASMYGDGIDFTRFYNFGTNSPRRILRRSLFSIRGMKIMTLIGVNSNERQAKQPLFVDLELNIDEERQPLDSAAFATLCRKEQELFQIIETTTFETLERLAPHTVERLQPALQKLPFCLALKLRVHKPRAIPFADAPSIEVSRRVHTHR